MKIFSNKLAHKVSNYDDYTWPFTSFTLDALTLLRYGHRATVKL
jgi:hypothetical protein